MYFCSWIRSDNCLDYFSYGQICFFVVGGILKKIREQKTHDLKEERKKLYEKLKEISWNIFDEVDFQKVELSCLKKEVLRVG